MIIQSNFKPAWWLAHPHSQTLWPHILPNLQKANFNRERLELPDGDFIDLDYCGDTSKPIVLILHGVTGSSQSHYAQKLLPYLLEHDYFAIVMNFRGASGEFNRLDRGYHCGETNDLNFVIEHIKKSYPDRAMHCVGFSLGANVLLKWLGENNDKEYLTSAIAVSVPFDLEPTANFLNSNSSRFYQWLLLRELKSYYFEKYKNRPAPITLEKVAKISTFWEYDETITAPLYGFDSALHYYQSCSSKPFLRLITTPTLIIHAKDDPMIPETIIPTKKDLSPDIVIELSQQGGHVGFLAADKLGKTHFWLGDRILAQIKKMT